MSSTRYGHTNVGGGDQDQGERKDEGWQRRQGGRRSRAGGGGARDAEPGAKGGRSQPPPGTNTQGDLAGIGEAADRSTASLGGANPPAGDDQPSGRDRDHRGDGTDQPARMAGPLGPDRADPHLPEGEQDADDRGSGARGFDRGVDASRVGAIHQGVREEDSD
jgi:hypothetical protein